MKNKMILGSAIVVLGLSATMMAQFSQSDSKTLAERLAYMERHYPERHRVIADGTYEAMPLEAKLSFLLDSFTDQFVDTENAPDESQDLIDSADELESNVLEARADLVAKGADPYVLEQFDEQHESMLETMLEEAEKAHEHADEILRALGLDDG